MLTPFDELDRSIIHLLQRNARIPASTMADQLGANERTIRKRINRLVSAGAVQLTALVEPVVFGYGLSVDVFLEIDTKSSHETLNWLTDSPFVTYLAYGQTGDLSLGARFRDSEEMHSFISEIMSSKGVRMKGQVLVPRVLRSINEWKPPLSSFSGGDGRTAKDETQSVHART